MKFYCSLPNVGAQHKGRRGTKWRVATKTEAAVKQAKPLDKPYKLADGGGLYLEIVASGSKYWRLKYRYGVKEKRLALGVYPAISISAAREKMRQAKVQLLEGIDPGAVKKQAKLAKQMSLANTFEGVAYEFIEKRKREGAAEVTLQKLTWIIDKKLCPFIGAYPSPKLPLFNY